MGVYLRFSTTPLHRSTHAAIQESNLKRNYVAVYAKTEKKNKQTYLRKTKNKKKNPRDTTDKYLILL